LQFRNKSQTSLLSEEWMVSMRGQEKHSAPIVVCTGSESTAHGSYRSGSQPRSPSNRKNAQRYESSSSLGRLFVSAMDAGPSSFRDLETYVRELQGKRAIKKVLIANNGIAAVKAIRFLRKWSYEVFGNEHEVGGRLWGLCSPLGVPRVTRSPPPTSALGRSS
jgi:hypothetical protein